MYLLFDFDGTINVSSATYYPAFEKASAYARSQGLVPSREMDVAEVGYWLGVGSGALWREYIPEADEKQRKACKKLMDEEVIRAARGGEARMFDGVADCLDRLSSEGHTLLLLSNCTRVYLETFTRAFSLERWFERLYCGEDYGWKPKSEIFDDVLCDMGYGGDPADAFVVIGDRYHDFGIARKHGLRSVGCAYGYGAREELSEVTSVAENPHGLYDAIESVL